MGAPSVAIVGAGFSGTLLTLHVLRRCRPDVSVTLIERERSFGRGLAYGTAAASHVLNVPAARMSAFHDRPHDFLDWLQNRPLEQRPGCGSSAGSFVPRRLFGDYVRALLNEEMKREGNDQRLELMRGDVQRLEPSAGRMTLHLDRDRRVQADLVVLAIGNFPPEAPPVPDMSFYDGPLYRGDPWAANAFTDLDPAAPVLLIGSGLTTVDAVISLLDQGHTGPITALSRRGLLPHQHCAAPPVAEPSGAFSTNLLALLRALRGEARRAIAAGGSWQPIVDELRPFTQDVWQALSDADRARFLRHLRPWWEVHRHRAAPEVAARVAAARERGQFRVLAGRVRRYEVKDGLVDVVFRPRGTDRLDHVQAARVVNCSGPSCDYDRIGHPLIRGLLDAGLVRPDRLRLGLDVTGACALKGADGAISRRLFAVGPVTRGAFWEMTAVPDIRRQCEVLAAHLSTLLLARPLADKIGVLPQTPLGPEAPNPH